MLKKSDTYETHVFAVIEERPKALDVFVGSETAGNLVAWIPRSQIIYSDTEDESEAPIYVGSYAEALKAWEEHTSSRSLSTSASACGISHTVTTS